MLLWGRKLGVFIGNRIRTKTNEVVPSDAVSNFLSDEIWRFISLLASLQEAALRLLFHG